MEALRRKTFQWEKINLKGKLINRVYTYDDGKVVDYSTTLAIRGEINYRGLGYCTKCNKIMTRREYEKHLNPTAGKKCLDCNYHINGNAVVTKNRNGKLSIKSPIICGYCDYHEVNAQTPCLRYKCDGLFLEAGAAILRNNIKPILPKKILTIKALEDWNITTISDDNYIELCDPSGYISVRVDKNGYVTRFVYNGVYCYYDDEEDSFIAFSTGEIINTRQKHKEIMRRLFA